MRVVRLISRSFLFFFFLFLLLLCAMQWNNNDNSRFVPPRNLLAYSTVCVCSSTSCELVYFQFLPPPPPPSSSRLFHVYTYAATCFVELVHSNCISFRASMCVHLCTLIGQELNIFHHAMKHWLLTSLFLAFNYKRGVACHWSFVSIFRLYYALW